MTDEFVVYDCLKCGKPNIPNKSVTFQTCIHCGQPTGIPLPNEYYTLTPDEYYSILSKSVIGSFVPKRKPTKPRPKSTNIGVTVGGDVSGSLNVAGRDINVHQTTRTCKQCGGEGRVEVHPKSGKAYYAKCDACNGQGEVSI